MGIGKARRRSRLRLGLLALIVLLFILSVPWYRAETDELRLILGLPDWVAVAVGCYVLAACLNSVAWLWTEVDDEAEVQFSRAQSETGEKES